MTQRNTESSKTSRHDNDDTGKPGSPPSRSRDVLKMRFLKQRDLTTIERDVTVIKQEGDMEHGGTPFINLMADLINDKGSNTDPFAIKWLVRDATQIKRVLAVTKARAHSLFDTLTRHATVAVIHKSSEHIKTLAEAVPAGNKPADTRVLTAFPSDTSGDYGYDGHVEPQADQSWSDGPRSMPLDNVSSKLNKLMINLHQAHVEKLAKHGGKKVKDLEKSGISLFTLEELMKQP